MYKVFIKDRPLMFIHPTLDDVAGLERYSKFEEAECSIDELIGHTKSNDWKGGVFVCSDPEQCWRTFKDQFHLIIAAGGIVYNDSQELLMILRLGKWDLPKGKVEKGESVENAAEREVKEECGVTDLRLERKIGSTWHVYELKDKDVLKESIWFEFYAPGHQLLTPQIEEDIARCDWKNEEMVTEAMLNTYGTIKDLLAN